MRGCVVALVGAIIGCAPVIDANDNNDVVDGCVGIMIVADDAISDAAFNNLFDEVNVTFSRCSTDRPIITCEADAVDIDACRRERLPVAEAIVAKHGVTAPADCTSLCEVE